MRSFVILTTRKRVIVALVHTVVFLLVAVLLSRRYVQALELSSSAGSWALAGVYLVVTSVLAILVAFAGRSERLYFSLCAQCGLRPGAAGSWRSADARGCLPARYAAGLRGAAGFFLLLRRHAGVE